MTDARFEDGAEDPVRLWAQGAEDLDVISALLQDSVVESADISWMRSRRRLAVLVKRFRWEDADAAARRKRPFERVQSMLVIDGVDRVRAQGVNPRDKTLILSLLGLSFDPGEDESGSLLLAFSGEGELAVDVECVDVRLQDVSRPYQAQSAQAPSHRTD